MKSTQACCCDNGEVVIHVAATTVTVSGGSGAETSMARRGEEADARGADGITIVSIYTAVDQGGDGQTVVVYGTVIHGGDTGAPDATNIPDSPWDKPTSSESTDISTSPPLISTQSTVFTSPSDSIATAHLTFGPTVSPSQTFSTSSISAIFPTATSISIATEPTVVTTSSVVPSSEPSTGSESPSSHSSLSKGAIAGIFLGVGLAIAIASAFAVFVYRRVQASRTESRRVSDPPVVVDIRAKRPRTNGIIEPYHLDEFDRATWDDEVATLRKFSAADS